MHIVGYTVTGGDYFINNSLLTYDEATLEIVSHISDILLSEEGIITDVSTSIQEIIKHDVVINKNIYLERSNESPDGGLVISLFKKITNRGYIYNTVHSHLVCKFFIVFLPHREDPPPPQKFTIGNCTNWDTGSMISYAISEKPVVVPITIPVVKSNETSFIGQQRSLVEELKLRLDGGVYNFLKPHQPEENAKDTRSELRRRRRKSKKS